MCVGVEEFQREDIQDDTRALIGNGETQTREYLEPPCAWSRHLGFEGCP